MEQAAFFIQLHPELCKLVACILGVIFLVWECLCFFGRGLYQPRNMGDDDLLTIKDFDNDRD